MGVPAVKASAAQLMRKASEVLAGTRPELSAALLTKADKLGRIKREEAERCADGHRTGCGCVVLAAIDEPGA